MSVVVGHDEGDSRTTPTDDMADGGGEAVVAAVRLGATVET